MAAPEDLPDTEQLVVCRDRPTGLVAIIAIDDTTLGPALGGIRFKPYPSEAAAVAEAQRLGRAMTLKNALADIAFGGGKSVILASDAIVDREAALLAFGRFVARCGGAYLPAADMGTGVEDLQVVARTAGEVSCDDEDPSTATAIGVHAAIEVAVRAGDVAPGLAGVSVLVQGVGHVGAALARLLAADGARVLVADADAGRAASVAAEVGGAVVAPDDVIGTPCDVYAPCAVARVVDDATVGRLAARIVAGAANDVLDHPGLAGELAARGILYVPDFVANAGGVINVRALRDGWSPERRAAALAAIGTRCGEVVHEARATGATTLEVAEAAAYAKVGRARPA
ncbi:Glu/Leu/Phe/Val dehydrogenase [Baekduia soli]|uniref:Glu/Leu/Phe/Val dehydrogenase n=1 Tax=Baekduia soli TaxID=496014 RepID=A0A5B8UAX3_9ACTN|nr:Glu/Leu/Phe/Val dehydrogenase dimerization domain-containing protein [Baekduia soli]QEC49771.1 Glu/Leu/Phe/Val dehydrogenase [Baekduia soli]